MPQRRSRSMLGAFILPLAVIVVIGLIFVAVLPNAILRSADTQFGPPSPNLSSRQRLTLAIVLVWQANDITQAVNPTGSEVPFTIFSGESVPSITGRLWEAGLITNPGALRSYLQYTGLDTRLQAGEYILSPGLNAIQIALEMQTSISPNVTLVILGGWRVEEISAALPSTGLEISTADFLQAVQRRPEGYSFSLQLPDDSLEGFLFPDSYTVPRTTTVQQLIPQILENFESKVDSELHTGYSNQGVSLYQAVTLASLIEREAILDEEMPMIASVFYNRLAAGERLASDPTVQYALGYNEEQGSWWTNPLSLSDLEINSPYNTYLYLSLPPGPICNPGLSALRAAAFPAQSPYYFFRAACDNSGRHLFAETYEQHLENECP
jgi:UPF0755 protein